MKGRHPMVAVMAAASSTSRAITEYRKALRLGRRMRSCGLSGLAAGEMFERLLQRGVRRGRRGAQLHVGELDFDVGLESGLVNRVVVGRQIADVGEPEA